MFTKNTGSSRPHSFSLYLPPNKRKWLEILSDYAAEMGFRSAGALVRKVIKDFLLEKKLIDGKKTTGRKKQHPITVKAAEKKEKKARREGKRLGFR